MEKENYDRLSVDHKWIITKTYLDLMQSTTSARMGLLPLMAALFAALLAIATFNDELIPLDDTIRFVITILLLSIPFYLYFYNDDLKFAQVEAKKALDKFNPKEIEPEIKNGKGHITRWLPDIGIWLLTSIMLILVAKIWRVCF